MAMLTLRSFESGVDLRQGVAVADANRLRILDNAYIGPGRNILLRPGLDAVQGLPADTAGLVAYDGGLHSFTGMESRTRGLVQIHSIPNPANAQLVQVHYADAYQGYLYVVGEYADGSVYHHYLDGSPKGTRVLDTSCPRTSKGVAKQSSHLFAIDGDVTRFDAALSARDWSTANEAGFLPTGAARSGLTTATGVGPWKSFLVVFFQDGAQLWKTDPDPAQQSLITTVDAAGCLVPRAIDAAFGDLLYLSTRGVRSIGLQAQLQFSAIETDVGTPVDPLVAALVQTAGERIFAKYVKSLGQWWLVSEVDGSCLVYSVARSSKVAAWSRYRLPVAPTQIVELGDVVYLRTATQLLRLNPTATGDLGAPFPVGIRFPFLDAGAPSSLKQWKAFDVALRGSADVRFGWDPNNPDVFSAPYYVAGDLRPGAKRGIELTTTHLAVDITSDSQRFQGLDALTMHFNTLQGM